MVRLATQDEVNAGADDRSVLTPKTAAARYASRAGDDFSGPVRIITAPTETDAQLELRGASGAPGQQAKLRLYGTFGTGGDTNTRYVASVRSGFDAGTWGTEYLDFWLNRVPNDAQSDANQSRVLRLTYRGLSVESDQPTIQLVDRASGGRGARIVQKAGQITFSNDTAGDGAFNAPGVLIHPDGYMAAGSDAALSPQVTLYANGKSVGTSTVQYGVYSATEFNENATASGYAFIAYPKVKDAGFTMTNLIGFYAAGAAVGAGATLANYTAFYIQDVVGPGNVYGLFSRISAGAGRWNMYSVGSANSYHAGRFLFSILSDDGSSPVQVMNPNVGHSVAAFRYGDTQQWLGIAAAPKFASTDIDNFIGSYSRVTAAKCLYLNSTTDKANTAPTAGAVGVGIQILGVTKVLVNQAGQAVLNSAGTAARPAIAMLGDGAADTGLFRTTDGALGVACGGSQTARFLSDATVFDRPAKGPTPPAGDASNQFATTEWVVSSIAAAAVGQIVMEPRTSARAGYLKANGAELRRADYPALWAYAQASGALVDENKWSGGNWGCFSAGDGATTFRIPELRGESIRCWDDGRGIDASRSIGSWQDSQNRSHAHGAYTDVRGDHGHTAWTDVQGFHGHVVSDYGHDHETWIDARGANAGQNKGYFGPSGGGVNQTDHWKTTLSQSNLAINGDGNHAHSVGMYSAGGHDHAITVNADGGAETRVRSVALLAMIRAY
ncbi:hypothetical protein HDG32_005311 [Paraburkholderia sp. CI2]|uniref:phage tail protein n=1 Tax=Paraburkholderia sp. CI2 TaxID=2723093 RepID=UPI001620EFB7|nr:phage tail protein [Paraburkholderia sp. CI2]MBB5469164.1 hypothetical protein [Paraburkholderia sp. CI2]